ncbi:Protein CBG11310 [Caenorhabditis briggsae]|uniref:Protein CBG11310 n=1 Tax=Caenorhabditis briggsae TaxID=6238 RepID=A8XDB3_CAEBR|nr:Protein CBG11310 [Caenorhabditis briggsae]CAP30632.1 Protein CBG11310 [Caenorhabditis briggsae]
MQSTIRLFAVFLLVLVLVDAQYRMMANSGPAWRQRMWRKTRIPSPAFMDLADDGLMNLLTN